jgi:hypothetical protein
MSEKIQAFAIVVTDQNGTFSIHTSWKKACEEYGFKYNKNRPKYIDGYKIDKHPIGVTIQCLELLEFITRKDIEQTVDYNEDNNFTIAVSHGKTNYFVNVVASQYYEQDDFDGAGQPYGGYYAYFPEKIVSVELKDNTIELDEYTTKKLLTFINIDYYEN